MYMFPWWYDDRPLTGFRLRLAQFGSWCALIAAGCLALACAIFAVGIVVSLL